MNRQCRRATNSFIPMESWLNATLQSRLTTLSSRRTMFATAHAQDRLLAVKLVPIRRTVSVAVLLLGSAMLSCVPSDVSTVCFRVHLRGHRPSILLSSGQATLTLCCICLIVPVMRLDKVTISAASLALCLFSLVLRTDLMIMWTTLGGTLVSTRVRRLGLCLLDGMKACMIPDLLIARFGPVRNFSLWLARTILLLLLFPVSMMPPPNICSTLTVLPCNATALY